MKLVLGAALCLALCVVPINSVNNRLKEVFAWKFVDYAWGKPEDRDAAIARGEFVPENNLPLGLEVWKDKLFITVPRWKNGVVSTLNYVKITDDEETTTPMTTDDPVTPETETETPTTPDTPTTPTPADTPTTPTPPDTPTTPTPADTPTPPDTPTTPTPADTPTTPTSPDEDSTPSPTASILPMPARMLNFDSSEDEGLLERFERAAGDPEEDDDEFEVDVNFFDRNSLLRGGSKSKRKSKRKHEKEEEEDEEEQEDNIKSEKKHKKRKQKDDEVDEENSKKKEKSKNKKSKKGEDEENDEVDNSKKKKSKKSKSKKDEDEQGEDVDEGDSTKKDKKKKNKSKKEKEDEDEDEDEQDKKKDKSKKSKSKKDKDDKDSDKKKKKKKCKPKPKPTTPEPTPTPETTVTTEATTGTETTAPPPPPPRSPALIPYPSFAANRVPVDAAKRADEPTPIVSVFRVWADTCDRLWVMDTGVADILGKTAVVAKPRILIYNLNNDELMKTYEFKDSDSEEHSFFANIIVDTDPQNCDKAFAYVPDLGGYGIVSYDFANDKSRRIKHNYFHFDPLAGNMEVGGVNFQWTDGVFSIALSKPMDDNFRTAYFHCLASTKEFSVSTKVLKNEDSTDDSYYDYKLVGDRGPDSQSSASYIHEETGIMFYTQLQKDSVNCWNTNKPLKPENIVEVASDNETMIFTNDLKVDREGNLWVLTDKLPIFIYKGLDDSEVNYRIFTATVDEAVAGTNCAP